jgi:hypothetical protein
MVTKKRSELSENNFCNQECYHDWCSGSNHHNHKNKELVYCKHCTEEFKVHQYRADDARFCSEECFGKYKTESGTTLIECDWCEKDFRKQNCNIERKNHHFCSKHCYGEWYTVNKSGQNHPNWAGGKNLYEAIRENISDKSWAKIAELSRDDSCYKCGKQAEGLHEHHIIPVMYGGTNEEELLMTLCSSCHRTVELYTMKTLENSIIEAV